MVAAAKVGSPAHAVQEDALRFRPRSKVKLTCARALSSRFRELCRAMLTCRLCCTLVHYVCACACCAASRCNGVRSASGKHTVLLLLRRV
jgi:hypothetical protein